MDHNSILKILKGIKNNQVTIEIAMNKLKDLPFEDIHYAMIDHHRSIRKGFPEVIYCEGKTTPQIKGIVKKMINKNSNILATRASKEVYKALITVTKDLEYHEEARIIVIKRTDIKKSKSRVLVVTAGTADIPVAQEASVTLEVMGITVERLNDVGISGIHRLLSHIDKINNASVIIAVAGMEGALASVIGGLTDKPVIAVPTSIGYGASFLGISALLTMLNTCASGVGVVNIDNGFGAGYLAAAIIRQIEKALERIKP